MLASVPEGKEEQRPSHALERSERAVGLERLSKRNCPLGPDLAVAEAAAVRHWRARPRERKSSARRTHLRELSVLLVLSASASAATPSAPIWLSKKLRPCGVGVGGQEKARAAPIARTEGKKACCWS